VSVAALPPVGERWDVARWAACALVVLALHALGLVAVIAWRTRTPAPAEPPAAAVMIDLAPAPLPTAPEPVPEVAPPPDLPIALPEVALTPEPAVAIPPPPKAKPPERKPVQRRAEKIPAPPIAAPPVVAPPQPVEPLSSPAAPPAAPVTSAPPSADALTNFQTLLLAQLNRAKRYPVPAQRRRAQGVAYLRFTMDRSGKVLTAQLERSSGHGDLDEEVLALIRRADPLPPIPPEIAQGRLELVVPVQFSLR
jgi:protein TonB